MILQWRSSENDGKFQILNYISNTINLIPSNITVIYVINFLTTHLTVEI